MEFTFVNGASAIARGVVKYLAKGSSRVKLLDPRVYRQGVYRLQEELSGVNVEKHQTLGGKSLEYAIEGSENVIYFTHDYTNMAYSKNKVLESTAKAAKTVGVKKLVCVCPIEHDLYYTEDEKDPLQRPREAEENAKANHHNIVFLHPNLVYGDESYLIRFLIQSVLAGNVPKEFADASNAQYEPIHVEDLASIIKHAIDNFDKVKGKSWGVCSGDHHTLGRIKNQITKHVGKEVTTTSGGGLNGILNSFWYGITHDQNMELMAEYYERKPDALKHKDEYVKTHGIKLDHTLESYLARVQYKDENFVYPLYSGYRNTELD